MAASVAVPRSYGQRIEEALFGFVVGLALMIIVPIVLWFIERQVARYALILKRCQIATREISNSFEGSDENTDRPILVRGYTNKHCKEAIVDNDTGFCVPFKEEYEKVTIRLRRRGL